MWIDFVNRRRGESVACHRPAFPGQPGLRAVQRLVGRPARRLGHRGFTLIEVLIAVIVLATGLLGMASLQLAVLKSNDSARLRTIATHASYDLVDRIRANPKALDLNLKASNTLVGANGCSSRTCTSAITCLKSDFCDRGLPSSTLKADCASTNGCGTGNCKIIVEWDDVRGDLKRTSSSTHIPSFSTCARLPAL